jgi:predicted transcriptional regulator
MLRSWLQSYQRDARLIPLSDMARALAKQGVDPAALAEDLEVDPAVVMRRLAALPDEVLPEPVGLAIADASGVLTYRKPLPEFPMPRFGAACPLWPLYRALSRPMVILSHPVTQTGRPGSDFWVDALAIPKSRIAVNRDPLFEAVMLVRPIPLTAAKVADPLELGTTCRVCARTGCEGRREPSILVAGAQQSFDTA